MTIPEFLLAKRTAVGKPRVTIEAHTLSVERAARGLFDGTPWGTAFARFFRLEVADLPRWIGHLRIACLFHDVGKANADFLSAVQNDAEQTYRHEHISAAVLQLPDVRAWLSAAGLDVDAIGAAVLSHHVKASGQDPKYLWCQPRAARSTVAAWLDHPEIERLLARVAAVIGHGPAPRLPSGPFGTVGPWPAAVMAGRRGATELARVLRQDRRRRDFVAAIKAGLAAADSAGSGLPRVGEALEPWIAERAVREPLTTGEIERSVIVRRGQQIQERTGKPFALHHFQRGVAASGRRVLLLAGCAAGKTLAAWQWAAQRAAAEQFGRVIFLYPTRATATEGFRDYVAWAPDDEAALLTGTARYELAAMMSNPPESFGEREASEFQGQERLFALGVWGKRYFSATVDQFLGFLENQYASLTLLPALADSALIVDEVHSFDRRLFDSLVNFLRAFDLPVLCMTATLPASRRSELEAAGLVVYPTQDERPLLLDLAAKEAAPRYRLRRAADVSGALAAALAGFRSGRRVLWVVNTVARAQGVARRLSAEVGEPVLCYHSRYRLSDRATTHAATVRAFQQGDTPAIAVTTQVCEMSLDLDADVLVTELAPIPALVQRCGRSNRHLARGRDKPADIWVYEPKSDRPYEANELVAARRFVEDLGEGVVSQLDLSTRMEHLVPPQPRASDATRFLDGGYYAVPGVLRDTDEISRPCVLDADRRAVEEALQARRPIDGWTVPVPARKYASEVDAPVRGWPRWLGLASAACYDARLGFMTTFEEVP